MMGAAQGRVRVLALADGVAAGLVLAGAIPTRVDVLVCNNGGVSSPAFFLAQLKEALRALVMPRALALTLAGRLRLSSRPLAENRGWILRRGYHLGLHAMGMVYRAEDIDCFREGILNAHIGLLPEFRGRSVMEWSVLHGAPTGITCFFIDEGIDTGGRILFFEPYSVRGLASAAEAKRALFARVPQVYARAVREIEAGTVRYTVNDVSRGLRYYVMSRLLTGVVDDLIRSGPATPCIGERHGR